MSFKNNLDSIRNLDTISITENGNRINLHSILSDTMSDNATSETYKSIVNQARHLSKNKNFRQIKGGSLISTETESVVGNYGNFSSTSSAFMTEIKSGVLNGSRTGCDVSATSDAFMSQIRPKVGGGKKKMDKISEDDSSSISSSSSTMSTSSSTVSSSEFTASSRMFGGDSTEETDEDPTEETEESLNLLEEEDDRESYASIKKSINGREYITGKRYLITDSETQLGGSSVSSSEMDTEDLTLFRN